MLISEHRRPNIYGKSSSSFDLLRSREGDDVGGLLEGQSGGDLFVGADHHHCHGRWPSSGGLVREKSSFGTRTIACEDVALFFFSVTSLWH